MKYSFIIVITLLVSCFGKEPEPTGMEGKTLPTFSLQTADSTTWINTKEIKAGKSSVFFLFTPHCPFCKSQVSQIVNEIDALRDIDIYMITPAPIEELKQFSRAYNLDKYANIKLGRDTANFFGQYMNVKGVPFLALYNKDKRLARAFSGVTSINLIKAITAD